MQAAADSLRSVLLSDNLLVAFAELSATITATIDDTQQFLAASARSCYESVASTGLAALGGNVFGGLGDLVGGGLGGLVGNFSVPVQLEFSDLQTRLLSVFLVILVVNVLLICYYWSKYGGVITDRFIRPSECGYSMST